MHLHITNDNTLLELHYNYTFTITSYYSLIRFQVITAISLEGLSIPSNWLDTSTSTLICLN